jgi:hypothetical protein
MDIHPPHRPFQSFREFVLQLVTITAGVLIALSLEGLLTWREHRALVAEARSAIRKEIADNSKELAGELGARHERDAQIASALEVANTLLASGRIGHLAINLNFGFADLSDSSLRTAERTGAVGLMDYGEVHDYSRLYALQELFVGQQRKILDTVTAALALVSSGELTHAPRGDLETFRQHLLTLRALILVEDQLGRQLTSLYDARLKQ